MRPTGVDWPRPVPVTQFLVLLGAQTQMVWAGKADLRHKRPAAAYKMRPTGVDWPKLVPVTTFLVLLGAQIQMVWARKAVLREQHW